MAHAQHIDSASSQSHASQNHWLQTSQPHIWHPYTQMKQAPLPTPVARAEGAYIFTEKGEKILDGVSSWWVNIHGHAHPDLNRALKEQSERFAQVIFAGLTHEPAATLAAKLCAKAPSGLNHVFYSDNGSTAVEVGLKMAYQYWRLQKEPSRRKFVALSHAYHGDTVGTMALGGVALFHREFSDLLFEVEHIPVPYTPEAVVADPNLRSSDERAEIQRCLEHFQALVDRHPHEIAGLVIEPILQGAGGMRLWPREFLCGLQRIAQSAHIPIIADEVFTGFGRTGRFFACEHGPISPDILCVSKALTAGYMPLAATLASDRIYNAFLSDDREKTFFHGHSFSGNALACALGLESLRLFDEGALERVAQLETIFSERLIEVRRKFPQIVQTRNIGGLAVIELPQSGNKAYLEPIGQRLGALMWDAGVLLRPLGNVLYFLPPYVITHKEAHEVFDKIEVALKNTLQ